MRKTVFTLMLVLGLQIIYAQSALNLMDISPNAPQNISVTENLNPWDTLFYYLMPDPYQYTTTGAETDGNHYYVGGWSTPNFVKYDMDGNLIETFTIPGVPSSKDMAYDGQYFYCCGTNVNNLQVLDLENKNLIQQISMPFGVRAIAYNDDLDVFYANDWSNDIKVFKADGTIVDTIPFSSQTHTYTHIYGFAYDNWSSDGPYLWAFSQSGASSTTLVQLALPSGLETGFVLDLAYLQGPLGTLAGGLFTYFDSSYNQVVIGGMLQNYALFGLELGPAIPPPDDIYAVSYQHAALVDSFDVQLTWSPVKHYLINEYFDGHFCPPLGWEEENNGGAGWDGMYPHYEFWPVPDIDSRYAMSYEDKWSSDRCCDYLISPEFELDNQYDYYLTFESYYDGSNNHSGYVKYTLDDGVSWELLHTMVPDSGQWVDIKLELAPIPDNQPVKIAFHADDNGGVGSGWAINNAMVYTPDISVTPLGYDIYRDDVKVNTSLITDSVFVDLGVQSGDHEYHIATVYPQGSIESGKVNAFVPYYPAAPPSPDCNPPEELQAYVIYPKDNPDILLEWEAPEMTISKNNAWDVQFVYPLAGEEEAGFTCDGNHFYTTFLKDHYYGQYDLLGNHIKDISVFEYSARNMEYVPLTGYTYISYERYLTTEIVQLPSGSWMGNFGAVGNELGMAYNPDQDAFYVNDGSVYIRLHDRESGDLISITPTGPHGNYYDLAYDKVSPGGPYLWGFSADGPNGCTIVQMSLPDCVETGFTYDASWLSTSGEGKPGGLFIMEDLIPGTASLCGLIQGELVFGLELGAAEWNFELGGYNVYMDNNLHNAQLITDTTYIIHNPAPGTHNFDVSAVYIDTIGDFLCESPLEGPVSTFIPTGTLLIGGNVIAGAYKLDDGDVNLYSYNGGIIQSEHKADVDELGYYFFPEMLPGEYFMHARPGPTSAYYSTYAPTYMDGNIHWEDVSPVNIGENSFNNDILLIEMAVLEEGIGTISGKVYEGSTDSETPLPEVQVLLFNDMDECIAIEYTNTEGSYNFRNLAFGTYGLLVEIPGKTMTRRTIYISESLPEQTNVNMMVLSDEIVFGINDELPEWIDFISELYPNPSRNATKLNIDLDKSCELRIVVFDISGQSLKIEKHILSPGMNMITIDMSAYSDGVYYVNIEFDDMYRINRKLLIID